MFERRGKDRIRPRAELTLTLATSDETETTGRVVDLSPRSMLVELDEPPAEPHCDLAWLETEERRVPLAELSIGGARDGVSVVEVLDPDSQARLWDVCDRQRDGAPVPRADDEHPGQIPAKGQYTEDARVKRLDWLRKHSTTALESVGETRLDARKLTGNIENFVGGVEIPVGLAGPMLFHGERASGHVVAPLATTEGTLVASCSRGATAITRSGGVETKVISQRMVRAPAYELQDVHGASRFVRWVSDHMQEIREQVALVSQHARLIEVEPLQIGNLVHLRFTYETGDAAGQNMTTASTWRACQWINEAVTRVPGIYISMFVIEGNASGDKKANYMSYVRGRGMRVTAEAFIPRELLADVLKTTPEDMERGHRLGTLGGVQTGMLGYSINAANAIAAILIATGQDVACVHESGAAIFSLEAIDDGLRATMVLPSLIVGTVGGGTALPQQRELLESMDCAGDGRAQRLAEIVCGFALALDLSTQAAVVGGQFADAHERLGRNRPVEWLRTDDLVPELFEPMLREALAAPDLQVSDVVPIECEMGSSVISELSSRSIGHKLSGLYPLRLTHETDRGSGVIDVVAKVKPLDEEVILESNKLASMCGGSLARTYSRWRDWTGFKDTHTRELAVYRAEDPRLRAVLPRVYGVHEDPEREAFMVVMERLDDNVILRDSVERRDAWTTEHVDAALRGIADVHAIWLGREQELLAEGWLGRVMTASKMVEMDELWYALAEHNHREYPDWIDDFTHMRLRDLIARIGHWWVELERMPRTLVHNDFSPRNIALRRDGLQLVAYDWELATLHVPQRDLAELLAFTLTPDVDAATVDHHLETHRNSLEAASGVELDRAAWVRGYELALRDFIVGRVQLYLMAHAQREYSFVEELVATVTRLIDIECERDAIEHTRADLESARLDARS
ncbi:MAG: phosphotransferase [Thermoleophilaceae bacterium]